MSQTTSQANTEGVLEAPKEGSKNTTQEAESTRVYTQTELDAIAADVFRDDRDKTYPTSVSRDTAHIWKATNA